MTPAEIAAYIGAAAWLPQLWQFLYKVFARPRLKVVAGSTVQIGYTTFGPIVNLTCAISSDNRDALIIKAELTVTHEKGDKRNLTWVWMQETQSQIRNPATGEVAEVTKQQAAVALQVNTRSMAERLISFQDAEFLAIAAGLMRKSERVYRALRRDVIGEDQKPSTPEFQEAFADSEAGRDYADFYVNGMYWQEGTYEFELRLHEKGGGKAHTQSFTVELPKNDIDFLRLNSQYFLPDLALVLGEPLPDNPRWKWANPKIRAAT